MSGESSQAVITPEGEQALVDRVFDRVITRIEERMNEAIAEATLQAAEEFKNMAVPVIETLRDDHLAAVQRIEDATKARLEGVEAEACRRMAHATEQVKQAGKDTAGLDKQVVDLRDELGKIVQQVGEGFEQRMVEAVAKVAKTATKYKVHVESAGNFLTAVKTEQEKMAAYVEGMLKRGISPEALDFALTGLRKKQAENSDILRRIQEAHRRRVENRHRNGHQDYRTQRPEGDRTPR